jgi:EpsI family protein
MKEISRTRRFPWPSVVIVVALAATFLATRFGRFRSPQDLAQPLESIPRQLAGWRWVADEPVEPDVLSTLAAPRVLARAYQRGGDRLELFIAFYASQQGGRAVHSPKTCLPGNGWEIRDRTALWLKLDGQPVEVNRYVIQNAGSQLNLLYWYQSRNRIVANEYLGKILLFRDALLESRSSNSSVRIIVPPAPEVLEDATAFATEVAKQLRVCLGGEPQAATVGWAAPKS